MAQHDRTHHQTVWNRYMPEQTQTRPTTTARRGYPRGRPHRFISEEGDQLLPTDMAEATFSVYLRKLRVRAGIAQTTLARMVGVSREHISYQERARKDKPNRPLPSVSRDSMLRIAHELRLSIYERDALLFKAGLAPVVDWMSVAMRESPTHKEDYLRSVMGNARTEVRPDEPRET